LKEKGGRAVEVLPDEEAHRILPLLLEDGEKRIRSHFEYAFDILARNCASVFSIWPIPNADALRIINGETNYDDIPFEDQNEVEKGISFGELQQFIAQHMPVGQMLCEVVNYQPCLQERCPLFRTKGSAAGGQYGICAEFKTAFRRGDNHARNHALSKQG
jgi:hypothetical protein